MSAEGQAAGDGEPSEVPSAYSVAIEGSAGIQVGDNNALQVTQNIYNYSPGTWTSRVARRPVPGSPYRGLSAFEEQDHGFFCGRDEAIDQVMDRLSECAQPGGDAAGGILVVSGASGAGKSSLLRAGVLPRLRGEGLAGMPGAESWPCLLFAPGDAPLSELAAHVASLAGIRADEAGRELRADPAGFRALARQAVLAAQRGQGRQLDAGDRLLLIIDQFEQLFTLCPSEEERRDFIAALCGAASAAEPSALVAIAVRADFEARCADGYPELASAVQDRFLLTAMAERSLELAITEPARRAGAHVGQELTDRLKREIRIRQPAAVAARTGSTTRASAGVLPLLSYALAETWRVHSGDTMTLQDYDLTGGIGAAVEKAAQRAYGTLTRPQQDTARQVFLQLTATSADGTDTSVPSARADLDEGKDPRDVQEVLDAFVAERLLTLTTDGVEISHEALLTAWPLLRDTWLEQTRADRVVRTRLRDAADEWARRSEDPSYLWSGALLTSASATAAAPGRLPSLTRDERKFLDASQRWSRRRARRRRAVLAIVCVLTLVAAVAGAYSVREQQDAAEHTATVNSTQLASYAQAARATDPGLAAQLAVAAYRLAPTEQASTQMYDSLDTPLDSTVGTVGSNVLGVAAEEHGPLAAASGHGMLRVWNLSAPSSPVLDATIRSGPTAIALSPDGQLLADGCPGKGLCLWNLANPRHPALAGRTPVSSRKLGITSMAISPDGKLLAAAAKEGSTLMWSIADPLHPRLVADLPDPSSRSGGSLAGVTFAPRGHLLAETILGGATRLWNVANPARPALTATVKGGFASIEFDPSGSLLAAVGDTNIGLWQVHDPQQPEQLQANYKSMQADLDMTAVTFSPDGKNLAFTGLNADSAQSSVCTLRIPEELANTLEGADPVCTSAGFQSEVASYTGGGALLTGGPGGLVHLWRWPVQQADDYLDGNLAPEQASPDGHLMATVSADDSIDIWNLAEPGAPALDATIPVNGMSMLEFLSPSILLIADYSGQARLWDLSDPRRPRQAASVGTAASSLSAPGATGSPVTIGSSTDDGSLEETLGSATGTGSAHGLVSIEGRDGMLHLWRITSPDHAVQAGSISGTPGMAGILGNGQTAFRVTGHSIQWWDISDPAHPARRSISTLPGTHSLTTAIAAGSFLAVATTTDPFSGNSDLVVFNVTRGRVRSSATLSTTAGEFLDVSPDNHLLAAADSRYGTVTLWDVSNPGHPRRLSAVVPDQSNISMIEFSPDSKVLAVSPKGAGTATVELWDIHNPSEPVPLGSATWLTDGDAVPDPAATSLYAMAFAGKGSNLAISTSTATFLIGTDPSELAARLCGDTGAPLSPAQWQQDAPGMPYQRPCP